MAHIRFIIKDDGTVNIDVTGVEGASCEDITRAFQSQLGTKIDENLKPEYYCELSQEFVEATQEE